jgi:hypothetical protein
VTPTNFTIQLVERITDLAQHLVPASSEAVHACRVEPLGFCGSKPPARGHSRQYRIQRAGTQAIAMMLQFLEHPLAVDTLLVSVMKDVDFPKRQEELAHNRIAHGAAIIALRFLAAIPEDAAQLAAEEQ